MNVLRLLAVLVVVAGLAWVFLRVLVPYARRVVGSSGAPTVVPGTVVPDPSPQGLPLTPGHGYDKADVDDLLDRVYASAETPSGRVEAAEMLRTARFHLARKGGYLPIFVDDLMDALADALATGRELPPRPDYR